MDKSVTLPGTDWRNILRLIDEKKNGYEYFNRGAYLCWEELEERIRKQLPSPQERITEAIHKA